MINSRIDDRRIAKNTLYMYIRMFFTMSIGLYTSRAVLAALGFEDYGVYNVVGGVVAMFGFINGAMSNTTSRYITYYLGQKNLSRLQEVFSTSFYIHVLIALLIIFLGETAGLWYVCNKLVFPEGREAAVMWLYQFTIISAAVNILSVPYNASIVAHEKMSAFATISIIDSFLKLLIAISLSYVSVDRLVYYGLMILVVQLLDNVLYWGYNIKNFKEIVVKRVFDKNLFKEMFGFTGWNLLGNFTYIFFTQGVNLILNFFCGAAVNAARGIAVQVDGIVRQFATNIQTAINPQIIKAYSQNEKERMFSLIISSSKYCFYLLYLLALPIILEANFLLTIWLSNFPEHTIPFLRITLFTITLEALSSPMFTANLASGKVKLYQVIMSAISFVFIPLTYISIKITKIPEIVFICTLVLTIIQIIARIFIVNYQIGLPRSLYVKKVLVNIIGVALISSIIPVIIHNIMQGGIIRFLVVVILCLVSVSLTAYHIGIDLKERQLLLAYINDKIFRLFRNNN